MLSLGMLDHRIQLLLDKQRYDKVAREARTRGTSVAAVIRDAIDRLESDQERRRRAIDALLAAEPIPVPDDPADLKREIRETYDGGMLD